MTDHEFEHAVEVSYGLEDMDTVLYRFQPFTPSAEEMRYVSEAIAPATAQVTLNGVVYPYTVIEPGHLIVRVPVASFHVGDGLPNQIVVESHGPGGELLSYCSYTNLFLN